MIVPFRCAYSYGGRMRGRASLVRPERILSFKLHAVGRCRLSGPSRVSRIICRTVYFVQWFARPHIFNNSFTTADAALLAVLTRAILMAYRTI